MIVTVLRLWQVCFFFNETATTEFYTYGHTRSRHDALPICWIARLEPPGQPPRRRARCVQPGQVAEGGAQRGAAIEAPEILIGCGIRDVALFQQVDRKSTRLNSSH